MEKLKALLLEEGYPTHMLENTIQKLLILQPQIKKIFNVWIETHNEPSLSIEGYSFNCLVQNYGMNPIGAFLTLDWLLREPEKAKKALQLGIR